MVLWPSAAHVLRVEVGDLSLPGRSPVPGFWWGCKRRKSTSAQRGTPPAACAPARFLVRSKSAGQGQVTNRTPPHHKTEPQPDNAPPICLKPVPAGGAVDLDLPDRHARSRRGVRHNPERAWRTKRSEDDQKRASERSYAARHEAQRNAGSTTAHPANRTQGADATEDTTRRARGGRRGARTTRTATATARTQPGMKRSAMPGEGERTEPSKPNARSRRNVRHNATYAWRTSGAGTTSSA